MTCVLNGYHWYVIVGYHYLEDLFKNANSYLNEYIIKTPIFMVYAHIIHQIERENQPDMHVTFSWRHDVITWPRNDKKNYKHLFGKRKNTRAATGVYNTSIESSFQCASLVKFALYVSCLFICQKLPENIIFSHFLH